MTDLKGEVRRETKLTDWEECFTVLDVFLVKKTTRSQTSFIDFILFGCSCYLCKIKKIELKHQLTEKQSQCVETEATVRFSSSSSSVIIS